jgi:SAM-dependent methyltransferase
VSHPSPTRLDRPSPWFTWHAHLIRAGSRVLDLACGTGRHALAAAARGAQVTAVDRDAAKLATARRLAADAGLSVEWITADLERGWPDFGRFDAVLVFNYLDRERMPDMLDRVAPGGIFMMETYLAAQRVLGWGPSNDAYLLQDGELRRLVAPFEILHGREAIEPVDDDRWRAIASVVALRPGGPPRTP